MYHQIDTKKTGNILFNIGTGCVVAAIATAALGTGGLQYMGVNPEALQLVAGCALLSATLCCVGVLFIGSGLWLRSDAISEELHRLDTRISNHENITDHYQTLDGVVKSHEQRQLEARIEQVVDMVRGRLEHEARESGAITKSGGIRRSEG